MVAYPIVDYGTGFLAAAELNAKATAPINDIQSRLAVIEARDQFASKTADETVSASATLQDDDHLTFPVVAGGVYSFEAFLMITHSTDAADVKYAFAYPSGTCSFSQAAANNATLTGAGTSGSGEYIARQAQASPVSAATPIAGSTNIVGAVIRGLLRVGGTGGTFKLQWAQNTSGGTSTLKADSWMSLTKRA
jgi:hypothetical protein